MNREERRVFELVKGMKKGDLLELCPGYGRLAAALRREGFRVVTADIDPANLEERGALDVQANMDCELPFREEVADYVTCLGSIEHFERQYDFLKYVSRVLRRRGSLFITTPNILNLPSRLRFFLTGFYSLAIRPCREVGKKNFFIEHIYPITYYQLRHMLFSAGFEIVRVETDKIRRSALPFLLLYPFLAIATWIALMSEPLPEQRKINREIFRHLLSMNICLGRNLVIEARKK